MEYYDIVFEGLSSSYVDRLLKSDLKVSEKNVIHSHLYDREKGDMIFQEKYSLNDFFSYANTGTILVSNMFLDKIYNDVLILIVSDENDVEVTLNVSVDQINIKGNKQLYSALRKILINNDLKCVYICEENEVKNHALIYIK
jgi:hypothetical protein